MENALFYAFSTIAQTLAAAIAFLGAFALYRLQAIGASLKAVSSGAIQPYLPDDHALSLSREEKYAELETYLCTAPVKYVNQLVPPYELSQRWVLQANLRLSLIVRRQLKTALVATVITIIASIAVLPLTPIIASSTFVTVAVFACGLFALCTCLCIHARFVLNLLK